MWRLIMALGFALRRPWVAGALVLVAVLAAFYAARLVREKYQWWQAEHFRPLIEAQAAANGLDPEWVMAVVVAESGGDPHARSESDARGLMQVTPIALREVRDRRHLVGDGDLYDPAYGVGAGCAYLRLLQARFGGDGSLALAAYHMGPTAVAKWLAAHPGADGWDLLDSPAVGPKTRAYVRKVMADWAARRDARAVRGGATPAIAPVAR